MPVIDAHAAQAGSQRNNLNCAASVLLDVEPSIHIDLVALEDARPDLQNLVLKERRDL
jgi:hypothetical protein